MKFKSVYQEVKDGLSSTKVHLENFDLQVLYLISLVSVLGSLSVSEIFGWSTFTLSIAQRVLMYPLVLIFGISIIFNNKKLVSSALVLSVPGIFVSAIHFTIIKTSTLIGCGFAFPCTTVSRIQIFGLVLRPVYLPMLSFLSFVFITSIILHSSKNREYIIRRVKDIVNYEREFFENL